MSADVLHRVLDGQGFDGTPLEIDLAALHVPYGASGLAAVEVAIREAAERRERIGLSGPIGCGKTSVLRYALDQPDQDVAPIWVSVARDSDDVVLDPKLFVAHVVQHTLRAAEKSTALDRATAHEVLQAATQRRPLPSTARRAAGKVAAKFWIANLELSSDVTTTLYSQDLTRPLVEVV
jgi:ATPase subunit of ABC transporter with duplicated ATPase domains